MTVKTRMRIRSLSIAALLTLVTGLLAADDYYFIPRDALFEGSFELLYWRAFTSDASYGIVDDRTSKRELSQKTLLPKGVQQELRPGLTWGFRLSVGYVSCDCLRDASVRYTGLHTEAKASLKEDCFWASFGSPGTPGVLNHCFGSGEYRKRGRAGRKPCVLAEIKLDYDALDLEVAIRKCIDGAARLRLSAGLSYVYLDEVFTVQYHGCYPQSQQSCAFVEGRACVLDRRRAYGAGPIIGAGVRIGLFRHFGFSLKALSGIVAGRIRGHFEQREEVERTLLLETKRAESLLHVKSCRKGFLTPRLAGRSGVHYTVACENQFQFTLEFGYEIQSYLNALPRSTFTDRKSTKSATCHSFNLYGFYLSFHLQI